MGLLLTFRTKSAAILEAAGVRLRQFSPVRSLTFICCLESLVLK